VSVPTADAGPQPFGDERFRVVSRRAVATLDEARDECERLWTATLPWAQEGTRGLVNLKVSESGGTVGPLPDGTIIEVEAVTWRTLATRAGISDYHVSADAAHDGDVMAQRQILDAFNASQTDRD
jgi:hypothetical protein